MNELLKINTDNEQITLSARELHEFLGVSTKFQDWFKRMCEYGFDDGVDFNMLKIENVPSQKKRTYLFDNRLPNYNRYGERNRNVTKK